MCCYTSSICTVTVPYDWLYVIIWSFECLPFHDDNYNHKVVQIQYRFAFWWYWANSIAFVAYESTSIDRLTLTPMSFSAVDVIICEGSTGSVVCPPGTTIELLEVNYGRTSSAVCHHRHMSNTNCISGPAARNKVFSLCGGKHSCRLPVTNGNMGGDPCGGTYKYLRIGYRCIM
jgi:hypothetical protein